MKNFLSVLLLGLSAVTHAYTAEERQLVDLYRAMNQEMVAANVAALDQMLTTDYTLTHMTGYRQSRAEWLAQVQSGEMRYFKTEEVSVEPSVNGDRGTLVGRAYTTANVWGIQGRWGLQLVIDFRKENGRWLMSKAVASSF